MLDYLLSTNRFTLIATLLGLSHKVLQMLM